MLRPLIACVCTAALTACSATPTTNFPPLPQLAGAPTGLAWIEPSGDVAIRAGSVEHVIFPLAVVSTTIQRASVTPTRIKLLDGIPHRGVLPGRTCEVSR